MISFDLKLEILDLSGEKNGWIASIIKPSLAEKINPGVKISYRIRGTLDDMPISQKAIVPIGEGNFVLPFNADMRKLLGKGEGDIVHFKVEVDHSEFQYSTDLLACLEMDDRASAFYETISPSHKKYFSKWIESAKTIETKTKRINQALFGLANQMKYDETIRYFKEKKF